MLIDRSGRIWAMRRDEMMVTAHAADRVRQRDADAAKCNGRRLEGSQFARVVDGVAVVPVLGMLLRQANWAFASYEEVLRDVALAQADETVRAILLDIDSPGGLVAGVSDAARALRNSGPKAIVAFSGGMAASAAYYLAAAADRVVLGSGAVAGSVGTVIEYIDIESMIEAMGARMVRIVSEQSPNKRLAPDSPKGRAEMQALVDASGAQFVADLAMFRGLSEAEIMDRFGQGLVFDGDEALRRSMADDRMSFNEIVAELAGRDVMESAAPAAAAMEQLPMEWESISSAALREHRADIVEEIEAAAQAAAQEAVAVRVDQAVSAERARMAAIDEIAGAHHGELVAQAKAEGWSAERLALEMRKADMAAGQERLGRLRAADAAAEVEPMPQASETTVTVDDRPEAEAAAEWDRSKALRDEFGGDRDAYLAWKQASAEGRARVLNRAAH